MFKVYWTDVNDTGEEVHSASKNFDDGKMSEALKFMEELRKSRNVSFVTMCSENPNSVGKPGVDEVGPDYNWTKRRYNERK